MIVYSIHYSFQKVQKVVIMNMLTILKYQLWLIMLIIVCKDQTVIYIKEKTYGNNTQWMLIVRLKQRDYCIYDHIKNNYDHPLMKIYNNISKLQILSTLMIQENKFCYQLHILVHQDICIKDNKMRWHIYVNLVNQTYLLQCLLILNGKK